MTESDVRDSSGYNDSLEEKYLLFKLEDEEFGIDISKVQSIEEMQPITKIPDMPLYVKGVITLRQSTFPVIDLRIVLSKPERDYDNRTCIIITNVEDTDVGLIVDTVLEVAEISEEKIDPPPKFNASAGDSDYITGIGKIDASVKILIDPSRLFLAHEVNALQSRTEDTETNTVVETQEASHEI